MDRKKYQTSYIKEKGVTYLEDEFWFDGELLARVEHDAEGDVLIKYFGSHDLLLGAVQLFYKWQQEMYDKYK